MRGLGLREHVFGITFLLIIAGRGVEERRVTSVAGEAFDMKKTMACDASLLILGATIKLSITHRTFGIHG